MKTFEKWLKDNKNLEMPKDKMIPMSWFNNNGLPAVVACTCCTSTMMVTSALIDDDGSIYCSSCAGE